MRRETDHSVSIGITAHMPSDIGEKTLESFMEEADLALYHAKETGRDRFEFYTAALENKSGKKKVRVKS